MYWLVNMVPVKDFVAVKQLTDLRDVLQTPSEKKSAGTSKEAFGITEEHWRRPNVIVRVYSIPRIVEMRVQKRSIPFQAFYVKTISSISEAFVAR